MMFRSLLFGALFFIIPSAAWATCPTTETVIEALTCSSTVTGEVDGTEASDIGGTRITGPVASRTAYSCGSPYAPLAQTQAEDVYSFTCEASGVVTLAITGLTCDLDIYILDDTCSAYSGCEAGSTEAGTADDTVTFTCVKGDTYYVVIEGYGFSLPTTDSGYCGSGEGDYTLEFDVSAGTGCTEDCDNGTDDDLDTYVDCDDSDCLSDPVCACGDADGDGYTDDSCGGTDCDDSDADISPGDPEICDGVDDDCDGKVDDADTSLTGASTWYRDADSDAYGTSSSTKTACSKPSGYVSASGDCNDSASAINPGASEICDSKDNDCDGYTDDADSSVTGTTTYYADSDGDSYGGTTKKSACSLPSGYAATSTDCDDTRSAVHPGASEVCNGLDDDCDTYIDSADSSVSGTGTWYKDADGDGYGDSTKSTSSCSGPTGYVTDATDCNDASSAINPAATEKCNGVDDDCDKLVDDADSSVTGTTAYYADSDGDKYGDPDTTKDACSTPSGYVTDDTDCDDTTKKVNPGEIETCNDVDDDCDTLVDDLDDDVVGATTWYYDTDGDGYAGDTSISACDEPSAVESVSDDCDDGDPDVHPGATETCNGVDDDCDGLVDSADSSVSGSATWYADADGDSYGNAAKSKVQCDRPTGYVSNDDDCDDGDATEHPGATEVAYDGKDQDCDGADACDLDGDGHDYDVAACGGDDCDDGDAAVYPGISETADGVDEDCDGTVDETTDWYDDDGDGFAEVGGDCDDARGDVAPSATEDCDSTDEDCDGEIDDGTPCVDDDGDGYAESDGDCNDADFEVHPGGREVTGNGVDDDCDGSVDGAAEDRDKDGYSESAGDCLPTDATAWPGAPETCDGVDDDCDGVVDDGTSCYDDDGDGVTEDGGDCDDTDGGTSPAATERENGRDDDCDGDVDEGTDRADDDGDGYSEIGGDCDDANEAVHPGAPEIDDDADDDCDELTDEGFDDADGDGFTVADGDCNDQDGWANPASAEVCDFVDNDCDAEVDEDCDDEAAPPDGKCGCDVGIGSWSSLAWLLGLVLARRSLGKGGAR